jgi:hypothetical protein
MKKEKRLKLSSPLISRLLKDGSTNIRPKKKKIEVGDLVLKWDKENDSKGKHSKF